MATRRKRTVFRGTGRVDAERVAEAIARPGIDPRAWITLARSELGEESRRFDSANGWIIDALAYGSAAHGNSLPCRVASGWPGLAGYGRYCPPGDDEELVLALPGGDPDEDPIIIGVLTNGDGGGPPETVAGRSIAPEGVTALNGTVGAPDCEIFKSPYSCVEQHEGERHIHAKWVTISADTPLAGVRLGSMAASHPIPRGDNLAKLLTDLITALGRFAAAGGTGGGPAPVVFAGAADLGTALTDLSAQLVNLLARGVVVD